MNLYATDKEYKERFDYFLEEVKNEEDESYENLPDNFRYGDKGEEMKDYIEMLNEASGYLEDANSVIEQI